MATLQEMQQQLSTKLNASVPQFGANVNPNFSPQGFGSQLAGLNSPMTLFQNNQGGNQSGFGNFNNQSYMDNTQPTLGSNMGNFGLTEMNALPENFGNTGVTAPESSYGFSDGLGDFATLAQGLGSLYSIKAGSDALKLGKQNAADRKAFGLADLSNSAIAANTKLRGDRMSFLRSQGIVGEEANRQTDAYMKDAAVSGELPQANG